MDKLDLERDKAYIIHQVLMYGGFKEIRGLFKIYPIAVIRNVFVNRPMKVYTKTGFNYIKNFVLNLQKASLPVNKYVNTFYGHA